MKDNDSLDSLIVRDTRRKFMMSQSEFAKYIGVSVATVNRWENKKHNLSYKSLRKLRRIITFTNNRGKLSDYLQTNKKDLYNKVHE
ncbi:MAG: putative transcriptional regulator [Parcubacteria group bacterium ADurb.Bin316]|nr:MAG: putative transcriptional regulator [Parcubacteria group bacterium ADurb.Bin316]